MTDPTDHYIAEQETLNTARAWIRAAATDSAGVRLEAEAESAFYNLETATSALTRGDAPMAAREVDDAIDALDYYAKRPQRDEQRQQILTAIEHLRTARRALEADAP